MYSVHTLTQANKEIGMHTDGLVTGGVFPSPLPRTTTTAWIGGEGKRSHSDWWPAWITKT